MIKILCIDDQGSEGGAVENFLNAVVDYLNIKSQIDIAFLNLMNQEINSDVQRVCEIFKNPISLFNDTNQNSNDNSGNWLFLIDYRLYTSSEDIRNLVNDSDLVGFDINLGRTHDAIKPIFNCEDATSCVCGELEIQCLAGDHLGRNSNICNDKIREYMKFLKSHKQRDQLFLFSSNIYQVNVIKAKNGIIENISSFKKDMGDDQEVKGLAMKIKSFIDRKTSFEQGFKPTDFAKELSEIWTIGAPCYMDHEFNTYTTECDGTDFTHGCEGNESFKEAFKLCNTRFDGLSKWIAERGADQLWKSELNAFNEYRKQNDKILSQIDWDSAPHFSSEFSMLIKDKIPWLNNSVRKNSYLLEIKKAGPYSLGEILYEKCKLEIELKIKSKKIDERNMKCGIWLPKEEFLNMIASHILDINKKCNKHNNKNPNNSINQHFFDFMTWSFPATFDGFNYHKVVLVLKWKYPNDNWSENPFYSSHLKLFYEEKWIKYIYDLWFVTRTQDNQIVAIDAEKLLDYEINNDTKMNDFKSVLENCHGLFPLIFWNNAKCKISEDDLELTDGFNNCLIFAISGIEKKD